MQISPGRELSIDLQMKVAGLAENVTVVGDTPVVDVKSSATETTISQSLLCERTDHPHSDQRDQLRAWREQQLGVRRRRRFGQLAAHRRRRYPRSGGGNRLDVLQLQHGRGVPVPGPRARPRSTAATPARSSTRSPSRAATASRVCSTTWARARGSAAITSPTRSRRRTRAWPIRPPRKSTRTSPRSSAARSSRTSCSSS